MFYIYEKMSAANFIVLAQNEGEAKRMLLNSEFLGCKEYEFNIEEKDDIIEMLPILKFC